MGSIRATKVQADGLTFDSKLEYFAYLKLREMGIRFEFKNCYTILPTFKYNGKTIRKMTWTPDFELTDHNLILDTKGYANDRWSVKLKVIQKFFHETKEDPPQILTAKNQKEVLDLLSSLCQTPT
jgi:hypothetical protein